MRGLKHRGEYALILSEDELVLFKAVLSAKNDTLRDASKESYSLSSIQADHLYTAESLLDDNLDIDICAVIYDMLTTEKEEFYTERG